MVFYRLILEIEHLDQVRTIREQSKLPKSAPRDHLYGTRSPPSAHTLSYATHDYLLEKRANFMCEFKPKIGGSSLQIHPGVTPKDNGKRKFP